MSPQSQTHTNVRPIDAFRNQFCDMGVVKETSIDRATDQVKVVTTEKGVNVTALRRDGFDFELDDCWVNEDGTLTLWFTFKADVGTAF